MLQPEQEDLDPATRETSQENKFRYW